MTPKHIIMELQYPKDEKKTQNVDRREREREGERERERSYTKDFR